MAFSFQGDISRRPSQPFMESTRLVPLSLKKEPVAQDSVDEKDVANTTGSFLNETLPDADSSSIVYAKEPILLKQELNGLNNRLLTYTDRVKHNESLINQKEKALAEVQEQLARTKAESAQQISMLRAEINEAVKKVVLAEQQVAESVRKLDEATLKIEIQNREAAARREREQSRERELVAERNAHEYVKQEKAQLSEQITNEKRYKEKLQQENTQLKLEIASLQENAKITAFELTMQENKVSETEKKLQYTSEDVDRKLGEQRSRMEKRHAAALDLLKSKHRTDLERSRKDFHKKLQDTLATYVTSEEHAKLDTTAKEYMRRTAEAEQALALRDEQLKACNAQIEQLRETHISELAVERKRRERLNKRLLLQGRSHDEIRQELENYRKLIEGLDVGCDFVSNTPGGSKRARTSLESSTPTRETVKPLELSFEGTPKSLEARRILLKRALTPKQKKNNFFFGLI